MKPSAEAVIELLRRHPDGITAMEALGAGCGDSLAQRIHEIRAEGHRVVDTWETTANGARIKRYRLLAPPPVPVRGVQLDLFCDSPLSRRGVGFSPQASAPPALQGAAMATSPARAG